MKLAIISDTHLGTKWGTVRERDSFDQAREAFEKALELGAQMILVPGDIFEARVPRQEIWAQAMRVLTLPLAKEGGQVGLKTVLHKDPEEISPVALRGVPVVALHGNHERRVRGLTNPVEALEAAGLLIHVNQNTLVFDTPAGEIAIHGMSNVPEKYGKSALATWNPKPLDGAFNILMLHQALGQYVFSAEERPTLDPSNLPQDLDLYLCGHIHYHAESSIGGRPLLFPGSTERTQLIQIEAQVPKGFYLVEIGNGLKYKFVELGGLRDFQYAEMTFEEVGIPRLNAAVRGKVEELLAGPRRNPQKLPLVRIKLRGSLSKEASRSEFDEGAIEREFADRAVVAIDKGELVTPGLKEKVQFLRELRERRLSIDEMVVSLLDSNLRELGYSHPLDIHVLYDLLVDDREEEAFDRVSEVVKELTDSELGKGKR